ncbi:aminoglycoside N(3)-acetyltransferase [Bacillus sp. C28GYM-DRY-1]|uniref:aminoglycoside N(3)-acetyltransferase n=1 Tax=Bacillus sp. C28GYM-DRY-1 TaxID=3062686 RepID=UPI00267741EE|nr:AAC(3) family N-acetyltransferase [Bacillus sp. C28GYM-DRY-1]MDO3660974.1 AAC(3) family N-acetyltransferase [Bacillus sp. C28GYM-DRY-1]
MKSIIENTSLPRTRQSIAEDLKALGLKKGMTVLVHSSLSSIGWVNGGEIAVIQSLMDVVTEEGTIVMPSQSVELSDPSEWQNPPVQREWWNLIRKTMPAYSADYTPTTSAMGRIAEVFRKFPGVIRSSHPNYSFTAWGKGKNQILDCQSLHFGLGEQSPLGKLYQFQSYVLLLGAPFDSNTCFHLAEYRIPYQNILSKGAPVVIEGKRVWKEYQELEFREELFGVIGEDFEKENQILTGKVGSASCRLFSLKKAVDFAEIWLKNYDNKKMS